MDSSWTSKLGPEQFKSAVLRAWDVIWTTSNTGMKPSEKFQRLCFFLKGGEGTSAAQPIDEPASISSNNAIMGMAHTSPMDISRKVEASASTNADQYFRRRRIRTIDTANKRHGGGPNIFAHYNHGYC